MGLLGMNMLQPPPARLGPALAGWVLPRDVASLCTVGAGMSPTPRPTNPSPRSGQWGASITIGLLGTAGRRQRYRRHEAERSGQVQDGRLGRLAPPALPVETARQVAPPQTPTLASPPFKFPLRCRRRFRLPCRGSLRLASLFFALSLYVSSLRVDSMLGLGLAFRPPTATWRLTSVGSNKWLAGVGSRKIGKKLNGQVLAKRKWESTNMEFIP